MLAVALVAAACAPEREPAPPDVLRVGVLPDERPQALRQRYEPLTAFLRQELGQEVRLVLPETYEDLVALFGAGELDLVNFGGATYVAAAGRYGAMPLIMRDIDAKFTSLNLAINARDAMPDGGHLTIEIENTLLGKGVRPDRLGDLKPGQYVVIAVRDTGVGMAPEVLERVFEPFFTTKSVGEGSGLGLSMVYGFAKQSGGLVLIESTEGRGTTVKLYLPRVEIAEEDAATAAALAEPRGRGERILVVEDDADVRALAISALESLGYEVVAAEDGGSAMGVLATPARVDLLLSDVVLPGGLCGPDLVAQVRHDAPALKVLFMSGYAEVAGSYRKLLDSGSDLLDKPFRKRELAQKVRALLDHG